MERLTDIRFIEKLREDCQKKSREEKDKSLSIAYRNMGFLLVGIGESLKDDKSDKGDKADSGRNGGIYNI